jgi:hypothetical protein
LCNTVALETLQKAPGAAVKIVLKDYKISARSHLHAEVGFLRE